MARVLSVTTCAAIACANIFVAAYLMHWRTVGAAAGVVLLALLAALTFTAFLKAMGWQG